MTCWSCGPASLSGADRCPSCAEKYRAAREAERVEREAARLAADAQEDAEFWARARADGKAIDDSYALRRVEDFDRREVEAVRARLAREEAAALAQGEAEAVAMLDHGRRG